MVAGSLLSGRDTVRTDRHRYSEFHDKQGQLLGRMLYDHESDPDENDNIAGNASRQELVEELSTLLHRYIP